MEVHGSTMLKLIMTLLVFAVLFAAFYFMLCKIPGLNVLRCPI